MSGDKQAYDTTGAYAAADKIKLNKPWYDDLLDTKDSWTHAKTETIHPNQGVAVYVDAGQSFRFVQTDGPNIIDFNLLGADTKDATGEMFDTSYTAGLDGFIPRKYSRFWSKLPHFRPMATYIDDNIDPAGMPSDEYWPVWHGQHCTSELIEMAYGVQDHHSCHSNFVEAAASVGLDESVARQGNINIFQPMAVKQKMMPAGYMSTSWDGVPLNTKAGDFIEFYAEIDLLVLAVHCPYGDQTGPPMEVDYYPIDIEVYDTGVTPQPSPTWHDWRPAWQAKLDAEAEGDVASRSRYFGG